MSKDPAAEVAVTASHVIEAREKTPGLSAAEIRLSDNTGPLQLDYLDAADRVRQSSQVLRVSGQDRVTAPSRTYYDGSIHYIGRL